MTVEVYTLAKMMSIIPLGWHWWPKITCLAHGRITFCLNFTQLYVMETKAFKIINHDEVESLGRSLSHCRQVSDLSVIYHLLSGLDPFPLSVLSPSPGLCRAHTVHHQPPSGEST